MAEGLADEVVARLPRKTILSKRLGILTESAQKHFFTSLTYVFGGSSSPRRSMDLSPERLTEFANEDIESL